jgi:hypothetical protein
MADIRQWEYCVETVGSIFKGIPDDDLVVLLNELGRDGWEVISVVQLESSVKSRVVAKRPVGQAPSRNKRGWP